MKIFLAVLFTFIPVITHAQTNTISAEELNRKKVDSSFFLGTDEYDYDYSIKNNILYKSNNSQKFEYQNISLGRISRVDLQNPLRILIFYDKFNTIIALDRQLNEIAKTNFNEINPEISASAIGLASQNNYWIFNQLNQQLYLYNFNTNTFQITGVIFEKNIKKYSSSYNFFYWLDSENSFYKSDIFGKKTFLGKIPDYDKVYFSNEGYLVFQQKEILFFFDPNKKAYLEIKNIKNSFEGFCYKNQILSIFTTEGLINYKINLP